MLLAFILNFALASGGVAITYLFEDDEPLLWRLAAGSVIGFALFGTFAFLIASVAGFGTATSAAALLLTCLPLTIFTKKEYSHHLRRDWQKAKGKLQGANFRKLLRFLFYAASFVLLWLFFEQAMIETKEGIFTGDSHNLGDLPFHLGAIFSFTDGDNFPPINPSFAGAKFSYPFIADLVTAAFVKLGAGVREAMLVQNFSWAMSLFVVLERFTLKLTSERLAGRLAPVLLYLSGGLGFFWFFSDYWGQTLSFTHYLWKMAGDYTINDNLAWGNSLTTLFLTQRSLLIGMPLTVVVLQHLWNVFSERPADDPHRSRVFIPSLVVGVFAGMLPLIHLHSLGVLFIVTLFLLVLDLRKWEYWIAFGAAVAVVAVPELVWSISGSASKASEFIGWHFGWDAGERSYPYFWLINTGLTIPLLITGIVIIFSRIKKEDGGEETNSRKLLLFYVPFAVCFVIANVTKLAPWPWDNIKVLIYWFLGSLPFVGLAIAWMWRKNLGWKIAAFVAVAVLTFSGALDVWRTISGQIDIKVFDNEAVKIAEQIKQKTPPKAMFLNAPTYNSAVVLTGRQSVMRFPGHLWSHGIDYSKREEDVKAIYAGGPSADQLIQRYGIDYLIISPEERSSVAPNEQFFQKFPVVAEVGRSKVYKTR
jgi:hypothetical protein